MLDRRKFLLSTLATATLAAGHPGRAAAQGGGTDYDVVIIGGGVAGLSAAATLLRLDPGLKVVVLEGRGRLGGRVYSVPIEGADRDAELGASYLRHPAGKAWPPIAEFGLSLESDSQGRLRLLPGMSALIHALGTVSEGSIQLNSTVTEVIWRHGIVGVFYRNRGLESAISTRRVICAVPTPLLLAETPRFSPALPLYKRAALAELPLDTRISNSILLPAAALALDGPYWRGEDDAGEYEVRRVDRSGDWLLDVRYRGGRAAALSGESPELIQALAMRDVGARLSQPLSGTEPLWAETADWSADNLALGAATVPADADVHASLAKSLNDTLFFAGEAAAPPESAGTVHGAYGSGVAAGEAAAQSLEAGATTAEAG